MNRTAQVAYRLRLADGFLNETRQDIGLARWHTLAITITGTSQAALDSDASPTE